MSTLTLSANSTNSGGPTIFRPVLPAVYVEGIRRTDLKVLSWEVLGPPTFGRVRLLRHCGALPTSSTRLEHAAALPPIGAAVSIRPLGPSGSVDFQGVVMAHRAELDEAGERLLADVEHQLAPALSAVISQRWYVADQTATELANAAVRFNGDAHSLASAAAVQVGSRAAPLFDASASARRWTVADALAYVIATAVPADVGAPSLAELAALAGGIDLGTLDITGLTAAEALTRIATRGGLELRSARGGLGLEFYHPGMPGRKAAVALQPAGAAFSPSRTNLWKGQVVIRRRPARRAVLVLGAAKRYESTFAMAPGWDASLQTARWRDFVRSHCPNWTQRADVYRKWVLNEHGWYAVAPWNLPIFDFSGVSAEDFGVPRPRQLLPCLSCDRNGSSLGVVADVRCGANAPWRRWRGPLWVSTDECAIYLGGDGLPADFFQAAAAGVAAVRVTATVEADVRLTAEVPGDPMQGKIVIDAADRAKWNHVHSGSVFGGNPNLGPPDERDDSAGLMELAQRHAVVDSTATQAELTLGWVNVGYFVGDTVDPIEGRAIELRSSSSRQPFIRSVRHDFGPAQGTTILLEG
jgi:hypothetical protein